MLTDYTYLYNCKAENYTDIIITFEIIRAYVTRINTAMPTTINTSLAHLLFTRCVLWNIRLDNYSLFSEAIDALYPPVMARGTQTGFLSDRFVGKLIICSYALL